MVPHYIRRGVLSSYAVMVFGGAYAPLNIFDEIQNSMYQLRPSCMSADVLMLLAFSIIDLLPDLLQETMSKMAMHILEVHLHSPYSPKTKDQTLEMPV